MHTQPIIRDHWGMVDCLFDEVYLGRHGDTLHSHEMLEELFRYFASHDPRFHKAGLHWNHRGFVEYGGFKAEGAIAAFLGLPLTSRGDASFAALAKIYRHFRDKEEARTWIRWEAQKLYGYTRKDQELWKDYPRDFPEIVNHINELGI